MKLFVFGVRIASSDNYGLPVIVRSEKECADYLMQVAAQLNLNPAQIDVKCMATYDIKKGVIKPVKASTLPLIEISCANMQPSVSPSSENKSAAPKVKEVNR